MTKRNYRKTDFGLLVPSGGVERPKRKHRKPWFVGLDPEDVVPKPFRWMRPWMRMGRRGRTCYCVSTPPGEVECVNCSGSGDNAPDTFKAVISGVVNGDCYGGGSASNCSDYNGTFYLDHQSGCTWLYQFPVGHSVCGGTCPLSTRGVMIYIVNMGGGEYWLQLVLWYGTTNDCGLHTYGSWRHVYDSPVPCMTISNLDLDFAAVSDPNYGCDGSGATVTVSAHV